MSYQQDDGSRLIDASHQGEHGGTQDIIYDKILLQDDNNVPSSYIKMDKKSWCADFFAKCCNKSQQTDEEKRFDDEPVETSKCCPETQDDFEESRGSCCNPGSEEETKLMDQIEDPDDSRRCVMF